MLNLSGYEVSQKIYESAETTVYRAIRETDNMRVILKTPTSSQPSLRAIAHIKHEAKILNQLTDTAVPVFLDLLTHKNSPVLVSQDFDGNSLVDIYQSKRIDLKVFLQISIQIAEQLEEIHGKQVIHKDINLSNLIQNEETKAVQIIDFGISSVLSRETTSFRSPENLEGTLPYISPEQTGRMNQAIDYRTDFYSLGVCAYELLSGRKPFEAKDPMEYVHCHIAKSPLSLNEIEPDIPKVISSIVSKLMSKAKEERYQSANGLKKDLERCLTDLENNGHIDPFNPGENDFSSIFQIPQRLYGRDEQIGQLLNTFSQVTKGENALMLVAGYSGIGKTALVNEIQKPIVESRGYFISGKFDQYQRDIPYSALIKAFQDLIEQILTQGKDRLLTWKSSIIDVLAPNAQVIIDVIPELELIIGVQPAVADIQPVEALNRLSIYFRKFVDIFATQDHPLVLFLDDLQWVDNASLDLIKSLITDKSSQYLFLISAYRDNEVTAAHPLIVTLEACREREAYIETINLQNLSQIHINRLVAESVRQSDIQTQELSELVLSKTDGNPFFTKEFLNNLYRKAHLQYNSETESWDWDIDQIQKQNFADNVVELMTGKIHELPEQTQYLLKYAACIGNQFNLETLALVSDKTFVKTADDLWSALEIELVIPENETYRFILDEQKDSDSAGGLSINYFFQHDRVQQAAIELLSQNEQEAIHLKIGRLMQQKMNGDDESLLEVVNHLNIGKSLIDGADERLKLVYLNLKAGLKAKGSTAYHAALEHFKTGILLYPESIWTVDRNSAFTLYKERIECEYLIGNFEEGEKQVKALQSKMLEMPELVQLHLMRTTYNTMVGLFNEAIEIAKDGLKLFGIEMPSVPGDEDYGIEIAQIEANMTGKEIAELVDLPANVAPETLFPLLQLALMFAPTYITGNVPLMSLVIMKMTAIATKHGDFNGVAFSSNGLLQSAQQNFKEGYEYTLAASKMSPQAVLPFFVMGTFVGHWRISYKECLCYLEQAYKNGLAAGDLTYARYAAQFLIGYTFFSGKPLEKVIELVDKYTGFNEESGDPMGIQVMNVHVNSYFAFINNTDPFNNVVFNENDKMEEKLPMVHVQYYIFKAKICYMFGDYELSFLSSIESKKTLGAIVGHVILPTRIFILGLNSVALIQNKSGSEGAELNKIINDCHNQLKIWADNCPENFLHRYLLLSAEIERMTGEKEKAISLYEKAIEKAREVEHLEDVALANELAAKFYLSMNIPSVAIMYMGEARYWYQRWGATLKVKQIDEKYPDLSLKRPNINTTVSMPSLISTTKTSGEGTSQTLDLGSVIKASNAISEEIVLEKLLEKLMKLVIENAGAQKGFLILNNSGQLKIEAEGSISQKDVITLQSISIDSLESAKEVPLSTRIIRYVEKTKEPLVLDDATNKGNFTDDSYVTAKQLKSVLCAPILHQNKLTGILYLENNLATHVFTPNRLELLGIFTYQMSISIENATLYANLENKVKERTIKLSLVNRQLEQEVTVRKQAQKALENSNEALEKKVEERTSELSKAIVDLKQTQGELIQSEKMASLGSIVAGVTHEVATPLGIVNTETTFLEENSKAILQLFEGDGLTESKFKEFLKVNAEGLESVLRNMRRVTDQLQSFKNISVDQTSDRLRVFNVKSYIEEILLNLRSRLKQTKHNITINCPVELTLNSYPGAFSQIVTNLIMNTLAHGFEGIKEGEIILEFQVGENKLVFKYKDNGIGMSEKAVSQIFDPFFTTKRNEGGSGLGMNIVYNLVTQKLKGQIKCHSSIGNGVEFVIEMPC